MVSYFQCFKDCLSNRKQRSGVDGWFCSIKPILPGVPQGGVLGPLFYSIYILLLYLRTDIARIELGVNVGV